MSVPPVVFLSVVGAVGAVIVYQCLRRYVDPADHYFLRVAAVVVIAEFTGMRLHDDVL